jgi:hypothetical protein
MKLKNCNPSFFDARDAIIQADEVLTGGKNYRVLWKFCGERLKVYASVVDGDEGGALRLLIRPYTSGSQTLTFVLPPHDRERKISSLKLPNAEILPPTNPTQNPETHPPPKSYLPKCTQCCSTPPPLPSPIAPPPPDVYTPPPALTAVLRSCRRMG